MIDLSGRHVLVTGGSRGIGAACCRLFARAGAAVMVHYNANRERAEALHGELHEVDHAPHLLAGANVARAEEVEALFAHLDEAWGRLDVLVNNAGIWVENPLADLSLEDYEETLAVNVRGPFLCARAALAHLEASDDGAIINVTSTAGQRGEAYYSPYAASKGAMISVTKAWSTELAPDIRVNSVAPGWVDTEMSEEALTGESRRRIEAEIPLGRVATAEDIAGPILFLASPLARQMTGEIVNVNGGSVLVG